MTQSLSVFPHVPTDTRRRKQPRPPRHMPLVDLAFESAIEVLQAARREMQPGIVEAAHAIVRCFAAGGKVLVCGNGGSAADAQHFAAELVGRFKRAERPALPVISLTADTAILTAWANDVGYELVFARQVEALGQPDDLLVVISTSGQSANVLHALDAARQRDMATVALLGGDGGEALDRCDAALVVPSRDGQRVQEVQLLVLHMLCEVVEEQLEALRNVPRV